MTDWNKLKVVDLKNELKRRGLPQSGLKLDLVNRLAAAENEAGYESEATIQDDATKDAAASTSPETIEPIQQSPVGSAEPLSDPITSDPASTALTHHAPEPTPISDPEPASQPDLPLSTSAPTIENSQPSLPVQESLPSVDPIKVMEDRQKRKRRSLTPTPSVTDVARKRVRQSDDLQEVITTKEDVAWVEKHNAVDTDAINSEAKEVAFSVGVEPGPTIVDTSVAGIEVEPASLPRGEESTGDSAVHSKESHFNSVLQPQESEPISAMDVDVDVDVEPDRSISPAIHPATAALYIRDLMRPLNLNSFKQYLTSLATPPGMSPDPAVVTSFYLDPIRTHGFFSFTSVSAASRVRSAIHDRIWPDEANRKPLWADFIPVEKVEEWIGHEQSHGGTGRSSMVKWEIYYEIDGDRRVTAILQEATGRPRISQPVRKLSVAPQVPVHPDRLALVGGSMPTPSYASQNHRSNDYVPSGPRDNGAREQKAAQSLSALDELFNSTIAKPTLYWQPVEKSLANARLDQLEIMTTKDISRHTGGEINRYTFEDGDKLVDRGPEIFPGIRPPRRENRGTAPFRGRSRGRGGGARGRGGYGYDRGYDRGDDRGYDRGDDRGYDRGDDRGYDRNYGRYRDGMSPQNARDGRY